LVRGDHETRGFQIDLFEQQVVGKVWITERMHDRAEEFWTGDHTTAFILSDEDIFLLKSGLGWRPGEWPPARHRGHAEVRPAWPRV
jgi:hypothetical protein